MRKMPGALLGLALSQAVLFSSSPEGLARLSGPDHLEERGLRDHPVAFQRAARRYDVPAEVLMALSYVETRWQAPSEGSLSGGFGLMHLRQDSHAVNSLAAASKLTGLSEKALRGSDEANLLGGAALLRSLADGLGVTMDERADPGAWFEALAAYSGFQDAHLASDYAQEILSFLSEGVKGEGEGRDWVLPGRNLEVRRGRYAFLEPRPSEREGDVPGMSPMDAMMAIAAYPTLIWNPAYSGNYSLMNRPYDHVIDRVVVHTTQGSYTSAINWFKNPSANVSAHYVIRSSDGQITQMVNEKNSAWHVACWNTRSIGIEHEGYVSNPSAWYTDAMYRASAKLVAAVCDKYKIAKDRTHIVGHDDVSRIAGCTDHGDPGTGWNWTKFMGYVLQSGAPAFDVVVDNAGAFTASGNWGFSSYTGTRYGADYRYAAPYAGSDAAWFNVAIPAAGTHEVFAWWPASSGYNSATPFVVMTTAGAVKVVVDQRVNGGKWNSLGVFSLAAGKQDLVAVSRWTSATGYVIADAIRVVAR